jgi:bifunctional NMN adenylyltransferase/nudix hydrolase
VFDHPDRDPRGRMITHAYMIELQNQKALPKIKAADDAKEAFWLPIARIEGLSREFFGDHQMIIKYFLGRSM